MNFNLGSKVHKTATRETLRGNNGLVNARQARARGVTVKYVKVVKLVMSEAVKYQQRLDAIAERRRQAEEESRLTRETEEERLKTAQEKRKFLRDRWLSESPDVFPPLRQDEVDEKKTSTKKLTGSEETPEEEEEEEENTQSVNRTTHNNQQAGSDNDNGVGDQHKHVSRDCEDLMAQRMFHDGGPEGRSVLGMVAVQVERDPKTGVTVVRSVAPVSSATDAPGATAVFDDGRKSIHAVGGATTQPSTEELGQILSIVDGVGMKVLLDEVAVTTKTETADAIGAPKEQGGTFSTHHATPKIDKLENAKSENAKSGNAKSGNAKSENAKLDGSRVGGVEDANEERRVTAIGEVGNVDDLPLDEGPVTLVFLGYSDADGEEDGGGEGGGDGDGVIKVERVIISEDGEETVVGNETAKEFQEIPLDGNGVRREEEEGPSSSARTNGDDRKSKRKTCQCCSVM